MTATKTSFSGAGKADGLSKKGTYARINVTGEIVGMLYVPPALEGKNAKVSVTFE